MRVGPIKDAALLAACALLGVQLLVGGLSSDLLPSASADVTALSTVAGDPPSVFVTPDKVRPLLGMLPRAAMLPDSLVAPDVEESSLLAPLPHFAYGQVQLATGFVRPAGRERPTPSIRLSAHQTAVAQRAIQPNQTPNAVPRTPLVAYQTAVAQRAILPNQTPNPRPSLPPTPQVSLVPTLAIPTPDIRMGPLP